MKSPYEIIMLPRITERSLRLVEAGKYTFIVAQDASKTDIMRAVEQHYNKSRDKIKVIAVNTMHVRGKTKAATKLRRAGHTPKWKKAIVTLAAGQKLSDFGV